jgi:hypothetical protein
VTGINNPVILAYIKIFPNPATNTLMVQNNELKNLEIKIFNITGVQLSRRTTFQKENVFDLSFLPSGSYIISIKEVRTLKHPKGNNQILNSSIRQGFAWKTYIIKGRHCPPTLSI